MVLSVLHKHDYPPQHFITLDRKYAVRQWSRNFVKNACKLRQAKGADKVRYL